MTTAHTATSERTPQLLRLLHLASPALPIGAYAYSRGLEQAVERGWLVDREGATRWIGQVAERVICTLDVPLLIRLLRAFSAGDACAVSRWLAFGVAARETSELALEDAQLGKALARLLDDLGLPQAKRFRSDERTSYPAMFALACASWQVPEREAARAYLFAFLENQVAAAVKLVPLGQTDGQRVLLALMGEAGAWVEAALACDGDDIALVAPGLAMASSWHETQYSRLFRS